MKAGNRSEDRIIIPSLGEKNDNEESTFQGVYSELKSIFEGFDESSRFS